MKVLLPKTLIILPVGTPNWCITSEIAYPDIFIHFKTSIFFALVILFLVVLTIVNFPLYRVTLNQILSISYDQVVIWQVFHQ